MISLGLGLCPVMGGAASGPPGTNTDYALTNANIMLVYENGGTGTGSPFGRNGRYISGYSTEIRFRYFGRKGTFHLCGYTGSPAYIYVDGSLAVTVPNDNAWHDDIAFNNASDAWHDILIRNTGDGNIWVEDPRFFTGNSAAGQIAWPTGYSNPIYSPNTASYMVGDGTFGTPGSSGVNVQCWSRFKATTANIKVFGIGGNGWAVFADGVFVARGTVTGSYPNGSWLDLGAFDGTTEHEYLVCTNNQGDYCQRISADNVNHTALTARNKWTWVGDSITAGIAVNRDECFATNVSIGKSVSNFNHGRGGASLNGDLSYIATTVAADAPDKVVCNYGYNNDGSGSANWKNDVYDAAVSILAVGSVTKLYWPGIIYSAVNPSAAYLAARNADTLAVLTGGATGHGTLSGAQIAKCLFIDTTGVCTNYADGIHPNAAGNAQITAALLAAIP